MKQRMVGAIVLVALAVIFIPMLLEDKEPPVDSVKLEKQIPPEPSTDYRTDLIPTEKAAEEAAAAEAKAAEEAAAAEAKAAEEAAAAESEEGTEEAEAAEEPAAEAEEAPEAAADEAEDEAEAEKAD